MSLVALIVAGVVVYAIGCVLVRFLGWPRDLRGFMRWGVALCVMSAVVSGLPELLRVMPSLSAKSPSVQLVDLVPLLVVAGLAIVGYVGWVRGAAERERLERLDERTRFMPRLPARPPAPAADEVFEAVEPEPRHFADG